MWSGSTMCSSNGISGQWWWTTLGKRNLMLVTLNVLIRNVYFHFSYLAANTRRHHKSNSIITKICGCSVWPSVNGRKSKPRMVRVHEVAIVWLRWRRNCTFSAASMTRDCLINITTMSGSSQWKPINGKRLKCQEPLRQHHVVPHAWQPHRMAEFSFGVATARHRWRKKSIEVWHTATCSHWCQKVSISLPNADVCRKSTKIKQKSIFPPENDATGLQWKWQTMKPGGLRPTPRSGVSVAVAPTGKAFIFGGVLDTAEDEERLEGQFSNEMHTLDLSNQVWRLIELSGKKEKKSKKDADTSMADAKIDTSSSAPNQVKTDGIFTITVGAVRSDATTSKSNDVATNTPAPRMKPGMAISKGQLYLYGGELESGSKQFTLNDFHSLGMFCTSWSLCS